LSLVRSVRAPRSGPVLTTSEIGFADSAGTPSLARDLRAASSSANGRCGDLAAARPLRFARGRASARRASAPSVGTRRFTSPIEVSQLCGGTSLRSWAGLREARLRAQRGRR